MRRMDLVQRRFYDECVRPNALEGRPSSFNLIHILRMEHISIAVHNANEYIQLCVNFSVDEEGTKTFLDEALCAFLVFVDVDFHDSLTLHQPR